MTNGAALIESFAFLLAHVALEHFILLYIGFYLWIVATPCVGDRVGGEALHSGGNRKSVPQPYQNESGPACSVNSRLQRCSKTTLRVSSNSTAHHLLVEAKSYSAKQQAHRRTHTYCPEASGSVHIFGLNLFM
jgi:hypothetical protein